MRVKSPQKSVVDTINDFYTDDGKFGFIKHDQDGFTGSACGVSLSKNLHIVILAPTRPHLERALKHLHLKEESSELVVVKRHKDHYKEHYNKANESNSRIIIKKEIWISHPESDCAFRGYPEDLDKDPCCMEIGEVVKGTVLECKILLRGLGWPREEIEKIKINDLGADDIPF